MLRTGSLVLVLVLGACAEEDHVRATNPNTGEINTFPSSTAVPEGWIVCPPGADCPVPAPCADLDESNCLVRTDCEAVYEPCASSDGHGKFLECKPKAPPPNVCAIEGESCAMTGCCPGLECCAGVPIPAGAEYCTEGACPISDRTQKHSIVPVDADAVLERLGALEVATWTYNFEDGVRHMGPMAQDFAAAFGLGATDRRIFTVDADGVALASIQALYKRNMALARENDELHARLRALETRTARLERGAR